MNNTELDATARMTKFYRKEYSGLIGEKIVDIRAMFPEEMKMMAWYEDPGVVFLTEKGVMFVPMMDEEGNGPGQLMVHPKHKGETA